MRIAFPHTLGREEVRRRLHSRLHEIHDMVPGGLAKVETGWASEDRVTLTVTAMGQVIDGSIDAEDEQVVFVINLPPALSFVEPMVRVAIEKNGPKLLA